MSLKRRAMREEERAKEKSYAETLAQTTMAAQAAEKFMASMFKKFEVQYNDFLKSAGNMTPASGIVFNIALEETSAKESELRKSLSQIPEELFQKALREDTNSDHIRIMYLRVDKATVLKEGHQIKQRATAAEQLDNGVLNQLLYHAAVILTSEQKLELEIVAAKRKLAEDFIDHLMFSGIQYQEMNNEKLWSNEAKAQTETMKAKLEEVTDIFNHAAEMKVAQD